MRAVLWMAVISVPLGGLLADRTGRPREIMLAGFALFALILIVAARSEAVVFWFVMMGLVGGLSAGPIMSLPARVLDPNARAAGMGLYFTMFYVLVVAGPIVAGRLAEQAGTSRVTFDFGAAMLVGCFGLYWLYQHLQARHATAVSVPAASA